jgi:hypothetical protein
MVGWAVGKASPGWQVPRVTVGQLDPFERGAGAEAVALPNRRQRIGIGSATDDTRTQVNSLMCT